MTHLTEGPSVKLRVGEFGILQIYSPLEMLKQE